MFYQKLNIMKAKLFFSYAMLCLIGGLTACAPVYRCGDPIPDKPLAGSNRLIAVVQERDSLCAAVNTKQIEYDYLLEKNQALMLTNDSLMVINRKFNHRFDSINASYRELNDRYVDLQKQHLQLSREYSTSITQNLTQGHLYDERIKEKERRLTLREQEISKREAKIKELEDKIASRDAAAKRLQQLLQQALLGFSSDELTTSIKDGKVYVEMSDKLMFASGKAAVQSKGKQALKVLAFVLKKNPNFAILVEGHTDNVPISNSPKYHDNWDLSVARATAVVRILQDDYQIKPQRLTASGRGQYSPRASNDTAAGRAKNRRTAIILSPVIANQ